MRTAKPIVLTFVAILLQASQASAAADLALSVLADRPAGAYELGYAVTWRVEWKGDAKDASASVKCMVKKGGMTPVHQVEVALAGGCWGVWFPALKGEPAPVPERKE